MPECSTCGFGVDFLRSCYRGTWRLFADAPDVVTAGRYYFAPKGTKLYEGWTNLGSRVWLDRNLPMDFPGVGEDWQAPQHWNDGRLPDTVPLPVLHGAPECIRNGELVRNRLAAANMVDGYAAQCFGVENVNDLYFEWSLNTQLCSLQRMFAVVINKMYDKRFNEAVAILNCYYGNYPTIRFHDVVGNFPAVITVTSPRWSVVICDGTANYQFFALQSLYSLTGPVNFGAWSSLPLWREASTYVGNVAEADGALANKPMLFVGHSYGAAALANLAARHKHNDASARISMLTYGCPKLGDNRIRNLLNTVSQMHVVNSDDFVTTIPPNVEEFGPFQIAFAGFIHRGFLEWRTQLGRRRLNRDGSGIVGDADFPDVEIFFQWMTQAVAGGPINPVNAHSMLEYFRRLNIRCPGGGWPIANRCAPIITIIEAVLRLRAMRMPSAVIDLAAAELPTATIELRDVSLPNALIDLAAAELPSAVLDLAAAEVPTATIELSDGGLPNAIIELSDGGLPNAIIRIVGDVPGPPTPGHTCATAGVIPFGVTVGGSVSVGPVRDWWAFTSTSGKTYTLTFTQITNTAACQVSTGTCASLTLRFPMFASGTNNYTESGATEPGYIEVFYPGLSGSASYTLNLVET